MVWSDIRRKYNVTHPKGNGFPEPTWPDNERYPYGTLLRLAFQDYFIDNLDHPVVEQLLG